MKNTALTIANLDVDNQHSIQSDLKIFALHNVEATAIITSLTVNGDILHVLLDDVISL